MHIVKVTYTRKGGDAKANVRYIENRPGKDGVRTKRALFGPDGLMGRWQAYDFIDEARKGSYFYRLVISPEPEADKDHELALRLLTERTMNALAEQFNVPVPWVAAEHTDHTPNHRHVHALAVLPERLNKEDLRIMREALGGAVKEQQRDRSLVQEQDWQWGRGFGWELQR